MTEKARAVLARMIERGAVVVVEGRARRVDGVSPAENKRRVDALYRSDHALERAEYAREYWSANQAEIVAQRRLKMLTDEAYLQRVRANRRAAKERYRSKLKQLGVSRLGEVSESVSYCVNSGALELQNVWGVGVVHPDGDGARTR
jgi:hypothetical protein